MGLTTEWVETLICEHRGSNQSAFTIRSEELDGDEEFNEKCFHSHGTSSYQRGFFLAF